METRQRAQPEDAGGAGKVPAQPEDAGGAGKVPAQLAQRRREAQGCLQTLSHHSYWFDLWIFFLFDLVLLVFIYLLP